MCNLKTIIKVLVLLFASNIQAQIAPTSGQKVLDVKESHEGEYLQTITQKGLSKVVIDAMTKRIPDKLVKYGFNNITITEVGQVPVPEGWATKMGNLQSNKTVGRNMLAMAKTYNEMVVAVDRMYQPEDTDGVDWKFQVNFTDNITSTKYKARLNLTYNPLYIIKESDLIKDLSK